MRIGTTATITAGKPVITSMTAIATATTATTSRELVVDRAPVTISLTDKQA
jgi:hypothetical protein